MTAEGWWAALLAGLRELGEVEEPAAGRTVVRHDGGTVTIVMGPRDWDDLVGIPFGVLETAIGSVLDQVRRLDPATPYLVYKNYELHPSDTPELPRDPEELRIEQWMREHPGQIAGQWYAFRPPAS